MQTARLFISFSNVEEFCKGIKQRFGDEGIKFTANARADYLPKDKLKSLLDSGFIEILVGIESASDKILRLMRKGITFKQVIDNLRRIQELNIPFMNSYWMVGYVGETHQTAIESVLGLKYLFEEDLLFDGRPRIFVPMPGTEPFERSKKYGVTFLYGDYQRFARYLWPPLI